MQNDIHPTGIHISPLVNTRQVRIRPVRLVKFSAINISKKRGVLENDATLKRRVVRVTTLPACGEDITEKRAKVDIAKIATRTLIDPHTTPMQATLPLTPGITVDMSDEDIDVSLLHTRDLMQLSGMLQAINVQKQKTGALPPLDLQRRNSLGRIAVAFTPIPLTPLPPPTVTIRPIVVAQPAWRAILNNSFVRVMLGLAIGVGLLFLISRVVNIPATLSILQAHLSTPRGMLLALLCGLSFVAAYSIRGVRWKLFLNPIGNISTLKAIQLFWVGVFLNFILPVRGGEVAKSLMLKRISGIPVSRSLPTVAMDKALDLLPVLIVIALVPFLGVSMDIKIWLVLGAVGGILVGMIIFVILAAWKRNAAIRLLQLITGMFPKGIGGKIEGFATGFVDSLLAGASQPKVFVPAVLLTVLAVICDGLFAMLAFWTIGSSLPFGTALFGYTVYITFYILPTTPGEVGTNEAVGLLVFSGLLHQSPLLVNAMFFFSHPYTALIMCSLGLLCLGGLGLTVGNAMKVQKEDEGRKSGMLATPPKTS